MPPLLSPDDHTKQLFKVSDLEAVNRQYGDKPDTIFQRARFSIGSFTFEFTILLNTDDNAGCLVVEDIKNKLATGRVGFETNINKVGICSSSIQIRSVYVDEGYREIGLATLCYKYLLDHFVVISDDTQTEDGAALWKMKLSELFPVVVLTCFDTNEPVLLEENGVPIFYTADEDENLDSVVWGIDRMDSKEYPAILASRKQKNNGVVLRIDKQAE